MRIGMDAIHTTKNSQAWVGETVINLIKMSSPASIIQFTMIVVLITQIVSPALFNVAL